MNADKTSRRTFIASGFAAAAMAQGSPEFTKNLRSMMEGVQPITAAERAGRVEKARRLMGEQKMSAVVFENGASMFYFTGVRKNSLLVIPAKGELGWFEPESYKDIASSLPGSGRIGIEEKVRFAVYEGLRKDMPAAEFVSGNPVTVACRVIKSPAEIALMQRANDITIAA